MPDNKDPQPRGPWWKDKRGLSLLAGILVSGGILVNVTAQLNAPTPAKPVALSAAVAAIQGGTVKSAAINDQTNTVEIVLTDGTKQSAHYPLVYSGELTKTLIAAKVDTKTDDPVSPNPFSSLVVALLPMLILFAFLGWMVTKSGAVNIGKFSGKRGQLLGEVPNARFADVAGAEEAVEELKELVEFLQDGERFVKVGAKAPRGALLVGPPGTGKTLLARAVAGEAGVPFFAVAGSDFVETFVGVGAKRARDLFDRARKSGKAIIFIDEIDAVGRARASGPSGGGESERENTLISMLNEMDGFNSSHIIVLAATNRADVLDPALLRPGRLDRQIQVPLPDRRGRTAILEVHAVGKPLEQDVDLVSIARQTPGMSGAELAQVVNEAAMEAGRRGLKKATLECYQGAIATVAMGRSRTSALVTEHDRQITAWHESGHTLAAFLQPHADNPVEVTIIPRGVSGGSTWMAGNDNIFLTRQQALAQLVTAMAGRAAEEVLLDGEFTQGAAGDLASATALARNMVTQYGMSPTFGFAQVDTETYRIGGELGLAAHQCVEQLLADAHAAAVVLIDANRDYLAALAGALLNEETLPLTRVVELHEQVQAVRAAADAGAVSDAPAAADTPPSAAAAS